MAKSREIKGRIKAVKNIQRITRTMQMIATSKFAKAQQAAVESKPYTEGLFDLVGQLASAAEGVDHPLLRPASGAGGELTLIMTSDRGLCGPYNANVVRTALRHLRERGDGIERVELVGKKGASALRFNGIEVAHHHENIGDKPRYEDVEKIAQDYIDRFSTGEVSAVRVVYMNFISTSRQKPEVMQLLPFSREGMGDGAPGDGGGAGGLYEFSPDPASLLTNLLPAAVKAVLFQAFNDAIVSEHVARMIAMKAATDNAGSMRKSLSSQYNRARQAQITTELSEIISGAAAQGG